ncbi:SRPBCC family protein [Niabella terrae]
MKKNSVALHRVFTAAPEKVFRAFSDVDAIASWLPPYGYLCQVHQMEFKEGGTYKMSFVNFSTGNGHSFGGKYLEIKPNEFLKYSDAFDDPNMPGEMMTTVSLTKVSCGTSIQINQEGLPDMIPVEMCYLGWQESLEKLKKLVEPNIPDGA